MDNLLLQDFLRNHRQPVHTNLSIPNLVEASIRKGEGALSSTGALRVSTGKYTGRSPNDKFYIRCPGPTRPCLHCSNHRREMRNLNNDIESEA